MSMAELLAYLVNSRSCNERLPDLLCLCCLLLASSFPLLLEGEMTGIGSFRFAMAFAD